MIPEKDKAGFVAYLADEKARQERASKLGLDSRIALEYLAYKNFEVAGFISRQKQTVKANELRAKLEGNNAKNLKGKGARGKAPNLRDLLSSGDFLT